MSDVQAAADVRKAVDKLNEAIHIAFENGVECEFDTFEECFLDGTILSRVNVKTRKLLA